MRNIPIDAQNKKAQFLIKENAAGITIVPQGVAGSDFANSVKVRVELVRKSQNNVVIYDAYLQTVKTLVDALGGKLQAFTLPFAFGSNLKLNNDNYLQIDLEWDIAAVVGLNMNLETLAGITEIPFSFKTRQVADGEELDTEFYPFIAFDDGTQRIETVMQVPQKSVPASAKGSTTTGARSLSNVATSQNTALPVQCTPCCGDGEMKSVKVSMSYNYAVFHSKTPTADMVALKTEPGQKITLYGGSEVYLIQA